MPLIQLILILVLIGVLLWAIHNLIPMDARIATLIDVVVVIVVILWLLDVFGAATWGLRFPSRPCP
jgi:hypothetical protein